MVQETLDKHVCICRCPDSASRIGRHRTRRNNIIRECSSPSWENCIRCVRGRLSTTTHFDGQKTETQTAASTSPKRATNSNKLDEVAIHKESAYFRRRQPRTTNSPTCHGKEICFQDWTKFPENASLFERGTLFGGWRPPAIFSKTNGSKHYALLLCRKLHTKRVLNPLDKQKRRTAVGQKRQRQ